MLEEKYHSEVLTSYTESVEELDNDAIENALRKAKSYNAMIAGVSIESDDDLSYETLLNITGDGVMGAIQIL